MMPHTAASRPILSLQLMDSVLTVSVSLSLTAATQSQAYSGQQQEALSQYRRGVPCPCEPEKRNKSKRQNRPRYTAGRGQDNGPHCCMAVMFMFTPPKLLPRYHQACPLEPHTAQQGKHAGSISGVVRFNAISDEALRATLTKTEG